MQAVIGLLLLFVGAELIYLVITGHIGNDSKGGGAEPESSGVVYHPVIHPPVTNVQSWGTHTVPAATGGYGL